MKRNLATLAALSAIVAISSAQTALKPGSYTLAPGAYSLTVPAAPAPSPAPTPAPSPAPSPAPAPSPMIPVQSFINAGVPNAQAMAVQIQACNTYPILNTIGDKTGVACGVSAFGSTQRFGKVPDPLGVLDATGAVRTVFHHVAVVGDPTTACCLRVDYSHPGTLSKDVTYWSAMELYVPPATAAATDNYTLAAIHGSSDSGSANWELQHNGGKYQIALTGNIGAIPGSNNGTKWFDPSVQPGPGWLKVIVEYKLDATGANGAFVTMWFNGTQVWHYEGPNTVTAGGDYAKSGAYFFSMTGSTPPTQREIFWRSYYLVRDNGYTLAQIQALQQ